MRNKKYWKRAAAWILAAAMVLSSNSFAALAEEGAIVEESTEAAAADAEASVADAEVPAADAEIPRADTEAPAADAETPAADAEAPAADTEAPAADAEAPAADTEASAADAEAPAADTEASAADTEALVVDTEASAADTEAPTMDMEVLTEAVETEAPPEEEKLIISDEAGQSADAEQDDFDIEPVSEDEKSTEITMAIAGSATGSIGFQCSDPYFDDDGINLFTNDTMSIQAVLSDLEEGREYTIEWQVNPIEEEELEEGTYDYVTWERTEEDDTLLFTAHEAEKDTGEVFQESLSVRASLVCDGEIVDSYYTDVNPIRPIYRPEMYTYGEETIKQNSSILILDTVSIYVHDAEHDYEYVDAKVTDVSVDGGDTGVVSIRKDEEDGGWVILGKELGTAVVRITYESPNPALETESYSFDIKVVDKIYDLEYEEFESNLFANTTSSVHFYLQEEDEFGNWKEIEKDYHLEIAEIGTDEDSGVPLTTARVDKDDPTKINITTGSQAEGWLYIAVNAVMDGSVVAERRIDVWVVDGYYKLTTAMDEEGTSYNPEIGEILDWNKVGLKLYYVTPAGKSPVEEKVEFEVTDWNGWKVVEDAKEGGLPTLMRVSSYASIGAAAYRDEDRCDYVWIEFEDLQYDKKLSLTPSYGQSFQCMAVFSDQPLTVTLDTSMLPDIGYRVDWKVGYYDESTYEFIEVDPDAGVWKPAGENAITMYAKEAFYNKVLYVDVRIVYLNGEEECTLAWIDRAVEVKKAAFEIIGPEDTCVVNNGILLAKENGKDTVSVYIQNANYPYGQYILAEVVDVQIEDPSVLQDTTLTLEDNCDYRFLKGITEGSTKVTLTLKCEELWGAENYRLEQEINVVPYRYYLFAYTESLYTEDTVPLHTDLKLENSEGIRDMSAEEYTLTYTLDNTDLITIDKDGMITSGSEYGGTTLHVTAFVDEKEVASNDVFVMVEREHSIISPNPDSEFIPGNEILLRPVLKHYSKEHRDGEPVSGDWTYRIVEMDPMLTKGKTECSVVLSKDAQFRSVVYVTIEAVDAQGTNRFSTTSTFTVWRGSHSHVWDDGKVTKAPTCTEKGVKTFTCSCGETKTEEIPALGHAWDNGTVTTAATCGKVGVRTFKCKNGCGATRTEALPKLTVHSYGGGVTVSEATVFEKEKQQQTCSVCGATQTVEVGSTLKPVLKVPASSLKMKQKQSTTKFTVTMEKGDSLKSVVSSNTKIVKVSGVKANGTFKLTAQKKNGSAKITITLESGEKKSITVKVQSAKVTTTKISGVPKKATLKVKKKLNLKPVLVPVTSQDKITYTSSNKKVATVSSKGVVTAKKKGTVKITVKSGKKKVTCTIKVTK